MSNIPMTMTMLALAGVIGLWLGNIKIKGVGLGIGGVLFGGILVSHFIHQYHDYQLDMPILHFVQEFGLILFVYTIGIQVGPAFFASLRKSGLRLNLLASLIVLLGAIIVVFFHKFMGVPLSEILGVYSGAVTNTPSLGAGQQILSELGFAHLTETMGMAYAMSYPFGICGILLAMWLIRLFFRVKVDEEDERFQWGNSKNQSKLMGMDVKITNINLQGLALYDVPYLDANNVVCSRIKHEDNINVPNKHTQVFLGDILHLVGDPLNLRKMQRILGEEVDLPRQQFTGYLRAERVVVTNENVLGKKIRTLDIHAKYGVVISRLNRAGVELIPTPNTTLQFGDVLHIVGQSDIMESVANVIGNAQQKLQQVQMLPVFIGIGLGVLLGSIPFHLPFLTTPLKLGLAGGPLIVALILARIGNIGKLYWFMPPSANLALREIGIVLFLAVVGLRAGGQFVDTLINGSGFEWMGYGFAITLLPLLCVGVLARMYCKTNYLTLCGLLAGSMTDPPALAFANAIKEDSGAPALAYATVYPLVMFLRIISPQLLAIMLMAGL